jgi:hypothetical protein
MPTVITNDVPVTIPNICPNGVHRITAALARRDQFHQSVLATYVLPISHRCSGASRRLSHACLRLDRLYGMVLAQNASLSYAEAYRLLAVPEAVRFLASLLLKPNHAARSGNIAIH